MSCGSYSYVFLDACFVNNLRRVDSSCELIDFFGLCADATCVIKGNQYKESPCNHFQSSCKDLDNLLSDEDSLNLRKNAQALAIDFTRVSRDPADIKIFLWGYSTDNVAILTCDMNLLLLCYAHNIPRCCFKAALKSLDVWLDDEITKTEAYKTDIMEVGDDPFFHYSSNNRCVTHCGLGSSCMCYQEKR